MLMYTMRKYIKRRPTSIVLLLVQLHEYEKCSIELSFFKRNLVANNVIEFHKINTKDKCTDPFTSVFVQNIDTKDKCT